MSVGANAYKSQSGETAVRDCERCGRPLSRYNPGDHCQACLSAGRHDEDGQRIRPVVPSLPEVAARLRALRRQRGMTLEVLAGLAGVSDSYLSMVENGKRSLNSYTTIVGIAAALDVPPAELAPGMPAGSPPSGRAPTANATGVVQL